MSTKTKQFGVFRTKPYTVDGLSKTLECREFNQTLATFMITQYLIFIHDITEVKDQKIGHQSLNRSKCLMNPKNKKIAQELFFAFALSQFIDTVSI